MSGACDCGVFGRFLTQDSAMPDCSCVFRVSEATKGKESGRAMGKRVEWNKAGTEGGDDPCDSKQIRRFSVMFALK